VAHLFNNSGKIQLVASPNLSDEDIQAIAQGYETRDEIIRRSVARTFQEVEDLLIKDRLNALAWLISSGAMEVKLAIKADNDGLPQRGIYHEKIGIFSDDDGNQVAFTGSSNETVGGLISNFESVEVYCSWDDPHRRVERKIADFERLWTDETKGLEIIQFTEVAQELLMSYKTEHPPLQDPIEKIFLRRKAAKSAGIPSVPLDIKIRDYQKEAIANWFRNNGRGMMKMATGTGKTITALAAASQLYEKFRLQALIIVCPFRHLVTQWARECQRFGLNPILSFESRARWLDQLPADLSALSTGSLPFVCVITTNTTFASPAFQTKLRYFPHKTILIGDEVHNLGADKLQEALPKSVGLRLGLSATPERWFDEKGTKALFDYFGPVLKPELTIKEALALDVLVPYRYYPIPIELTEDEREQYLKLSAKIAQAFLLLKNGDQQPEWDESPILQELLIRRARLISVASNKNVALRELMRDKINDSHMLFYCGDGSVGDETSEETIRHVESVQRLLGYDLGIRIAPYTAETPLDERDDLRKKFDRGELQGLVAIRCLDEGVDIPSIRTAVILASSSNPRQFIQRRGRILRKHPNKVSAEIYDLIVVPPDEATDSESERSLLKKELARFVEFADLAINAGEARSKILKIQKDFGLLDM
jgi:DNA phosphorothioation system restriction enzyme